jgi:hypothetical protein
VGVVHHPPLGWVLVPSCGTECPPSSVVVLAAKHVTVLTDMMSCLLKHAGYSYAPVCSRVGALQAWQ